MNQAALSTNPQNMIVNADHTVTVSAGTGSTIKTSTIIVASTVLAIVIAASVLPPVIVTLITKPGSSSPTTSNPSTTNPSTINSSTINPSTISPSTSNPSTINPSSSNPPTTNPSTINPSTSNPSASSPSTSNPSTSNPSSQGLSVVGKSISSGYQIPLAKQGVDDERFSNTLPSTTIARTSRYNAVSNLVGHKVHKRNVFWHVLESTTMPSNTSNITCPSGTFKWPANETQRIQTGCNWFHCMNTAAVSNLDTVFSFDTAYALETAAVVWGTPSTYIHPNCTGNTQLGKVPCIPMIEMMPAYYDWIAFLAVRWSNIVHYIIGNEVDASTYFDPSPYSNDVNQSIVNTTDGAAWVDRYVDLLTTAHRAIVQNRPGIPAMLYVSTDRMWTATPWCPGPKWGSRCPLGTGNLLDGLWAKIGTSIDWSVAVHAYGLVNGSDWQLRQPYQAYTFQDLPRVIAYQKSKLALDSSVSNIDLAPQAFIAATEQSWNSGLPAEAIITAWYICLAHNIAASNKNIVFATHLDFQEIYTPGANQHGIIPLAAGDYLNGTDANATTALAYGSTNPNVWGVSSGHFCCQTYNLGCLITG